METEKRICSKCGLEKILSKEFFNTQGKLGEKLRKDCKECQHKQQSKSYQKKKESYKVSCKKYRDNLKEQNQKLLWSFLLQNPCTICGETNPVVLELDHVKDKKYNIADIIYCHTWESVQKEIEKCQVLCSNCHKKKTAKDFGHYRFIENIKEFLQ